MSDVVIVAIIAAAGTLLSGIVSAIMSNRVTVYRIDILTKEVEKHNKVIERTGILEQRVDDMDYRLKNVEHAK